LGHVTDLAFDGGGVGPDIMAEATAGPFVRREQAAEHAQECGFAASIGSEESIDLAALNSKVDAVDDSAISETFGDALHVNDRF
jgi:hypothetical protein